jgi:hypothetical protein
MRRQVKDSGNNEPPPIILTVGVHGEEKLLKVASGKMEDIAMVVEAMKAVERKR